ncbi:lysylphosphatidylglycerol synthase transmembrane domain-containing protein [Spiribacter insolitus]|uniref:Lysylphosphatidylglycerol synthase transmembrane domain-containing protein n=1 Tax=Spiribacter insolitus TaxID=3122417 RepID=A0ABV3T5V7_9GAMM
MPRLIRLLVSAGILGFIALQFGDGVVGQLQRIELRWILAGLVITVLQVILSAWRWRFTATRLQLTLAAGTAVREYYLATLVNQILPGGVIGDAQRAWRHGSDAPRRTPAFQAVVIERFSGQLAMAGLAILSWWLWPPGDGLITIGNAARTALLALAVLTGGAGLAIAIGWRPPWLRDWWQALQRALLTPAVLPVQLLASLLVAASYIAVYACCVMALAPSSSAADWLPLIPLVLFTMLIPASIAGWGLREGAAAILWPMAGLPAAEGISAAVLYGGLTLLASTPGLVSLTRR